VGVTGFRGFWALKWAWQTGVRVGVANFVALEWAWSVMGVRVGVSYGR